MKMTKKCSKIMKMMAKVEFTTGKLYKIYARQFPEFKDFWLGLVSEEENHVKLIEKLLSGVEKGTVHFNEKDCKLKVIKTTLQYAENNFNMTKKYKASFKNILSIAEHIENNIVDTDFYSCLKGDSAEFKEITSQIISETREHLDKIQKLLAENRPK